MTDDRTLLFNTLREISHRCGYILNSCKDTKEMRQEASVMLNLANKALLADPAPKIVYSPCERHNGLSFTMVVGPVAPATVVCPLCNPPSISVDSAAKVKT